MEVWEKEAGDKALNNIGRMRRAVVSVKDEIQKTAREESSNAQFYMSHPLPGSLFFLAKRTGFLRKIQEYAAVFRKGHAQKHSDGTDGR